MKFSGTEKVAGLLIALGADSCAKLLKMMENDEVERLAAEISKIQQLSPESTDLIITEFHEKLMTSEVSSTGGLGYATAVLSKAFGTETAMNAINQIKEGSSAQSFDELTASASSYNLLLDIIKDEQPQIIAIILSHIKERKSSQMLSSLPVELQAEVIVCMANMKTVSSEIISHINDSLRKKLYDKEVVYTGGIKTAARILNRADIDIEKQIMENITKQDPELAEKISDLMFIYDDIVLIADMGVQRLLQEIDENDLLMALKASTERIKNKFYKNMSERRRESIKKDLDIMPPVRLRDVQAAQGRILDTAKEMILSGDIEVIRDAVQEVFV